MKYVTDTLKYLKSNLLLLPALAVAVAACVPLVDYNAINTVYASLTGNQTAVGYTQWLVLFLPFNCENWITGITSAIAFIVLALDLAFIHTMVDKHIRFGTKSFRSVLSSLTINSAYSLLLVTVILVCCTVLSLLLAAIMFTFSLAESAVAIPAGLIICLIVAVALLYLTCHFFLWLPCVEITGFRILEALSYSYAHARPRRWIIFLSVILSVVVATGISYVVTLFADRITACVVSPLIDGCTFLILAVMSYIVYADAEGIEREDLKKFR